MTFWGDLKILSSDLQVRKKMQHVNNRDNYPKKKECSHWCSVSSVRMTGSKLYPSIDQWWRTLNEHL